MHNNIVQSKNLAQRVETVCTQAVQIACRTGFQINGYEKPYRTFIRNKEKLSISFADGIILYHPNLTKKKHTKFSSVSKNLPEAIAFLENLIPVKDGNAKTK